MAAHNGVHRSTLIALIAALLAACASPEERFARHVKNAEEMVAAGDLQEAVLELRGALKIDPESVEANERLGELFLARGTAEAEFYYREAYRADPDRVDLGMRVARLRLIAGDRRGARELIDSALERRPQATSVHVARAELALTRSWSPR